ncbi:lipase 3-like [Lycorma delicatula]|uniref:lipase 3-like n=1 Tax=Lycorma delicatula TaxID=130591 RepID=UPI003F518966
MIEKHILFKLKIIIILLTEKNSFCNATETFPMTTIDMKTVVNSLVSGDAFNVNNLLNLSEKYSKDAEINDIDSDIYVYGKYLNTSELIVKRGYTAEEYKVTTEDGYILLLTRIITGKSGPHRPVLFLHGLLSASDQWLLPGCNESLAFILADNGYDVWLGDQRGNVNSQAHNKYDVDSKKFWDFSFHEFGVYDLPAFIEKILAITEASQLSYIGHSLGACEFLIMGSERPEYLEKVKVSILLAPFFNPPRISQSLILNTINLFSPIIMNPLVRATKYSIFPRTKALQTAIQRFCSPEVAIDICLTIVGDVVGDNRKNLDRKLVPFYLSSVPAGGSLKTTEHMVQSFKSGKTRHFSYNLVENLRRYGQITPPNYNIKNIKTPIALVYGNNDGFLKTKSIQRYAKELKNVVMNYWVEDPFFNHFDGIFGKNAAELVHKKLLKLLNNYN